MGISIQYSSFDALLGGRGGRSFYNAPAGILSQLLQVSDRVWERTAGRVGGW